MILWASADVKDDNGRARQSRSLVGFQRIASAMLKARAAAGIVSARAYGMSSGISDAAPTPQG